METTRQEVDSLPTSNNSLTNNLDLIAVSQAQPKTIEQPTAPAQARTSDEPEQEKSYAAQATEWLSDKIFGCEPNPVFEEALWTAASALYDPSFRNDIYDGFQNGDACKMKTDLGAVLEANKVLDLTGDPYTRVVPREETEYFDESVRGDRETLGIGIELLPNNENPKSKSNIIETVFPGGPADKAGLKPGDRIMSANGEQTTSADYETIMGLVHGDKGTKVDLKIDRDGKMIDVSAVRDEVTVPSTVSKMVNGDTLYVRIFDFLNERTDADLAKALKDNPNAKSILLDLRGNGGGRLEEMKETVSLVMDEGTLYKQQARDMNNDRIVETTASLDKDSIVIAGGYPTVEHLPRHQNLTGDKPLVILTDRETASAAELFTAAVKDNNRGFVIGDTTFGKGIGQSTHELSNGAMLMVTSARFERPNGKWVGDGHYVKTGIKPDYTIYNSATADQFAPTSKEDNQYQFALGWLKRAERTRGN